MNEETQVTQTITAPETTVTNQVEKTTDASVATDTEKSKEVESLLAQKAHFRDKAEKEAAARIAAEKEVERLKKTMSGSRGLDVEDYIDISASLEGLDQREKEYLAQQHKLSGKPIREIRSSEDFQFWQTAYQQKVEKEKSLKPSSTQAIEDRPKTLNERLKTASLEEKEKLLAEAGLWKSPRPRADRVKIG